MFIPGFTDKGRPSKRGYLCYPTLESASAVSQTPPSHHSLLLILSGSSFPPIYKQARALLLPTILTKTRHILQREPQIQTRTPPPPAISGVSFLKLPSIIQHSNQFKGTIFFPSPQKNPISQGSLSRSSGSHRSRDSIPIPVGISFYLPCSIFSNFERSSTISPFGAHFVRAIPESRIPRQVSVQ